MRLYPSFAELVALSSLVILPAIGRAEIASTCPTSIAVSQAFSGNAPEGWSSYDAKCDYPLTNVSFWSGPPTDKAQLVPDQRIRRANSEVDTWTFPDSPNAYWVACEYAGTSVLMARPLGKGTRACTVEYDGRFSNPVARTWHCTAAR
ncbi:STY0301 family protein [Trinickia symbiotica]|uniref:STY0301 family protein n=1 Tax=Trinickia symbiotica TaxID=863227 RepID=UPI0037DD35AD